nr:hypothetical protein SYMBAF_20002 [Serratia symbiotica]
MASVTACGNNCPGRANEALDCRVYSYAALCGLFYMGLKLNSLADSIVLNPDRLLPAPVESVEKPNLRLPGGVTEEPAEKPKRKRLSQLLPS